MSGSMKSDDLLLLALHGFVISVGFFISIYPGKESNVTENNENDVHSNISYKILLFFSEEVYDHNAELRS